MAERKRKRNSEHGSERAQKRVAFETPSDIVKVRHVPIESEWLPILASAPGLVLSSKISLKPYQKTQTEHGRTSSQLLLHSSPHPRLEYTACKEEPDAIENLQNHYIGIYDPTNGELQLVEARKVAIRRTVYLNEDNESKSDQNTSSPKLPARSALGLAFGTKKSQKAIRDLTENAIASSPAKSLNTTQSSLSKTAFDPIASIVLESMAASTISMPSREKMQAAADDAKPIPKPNLQAEELVDVYPIEQLVSLEAMRTLPVKDWMDKIESGEDIITKSRFVSHRVRQVVKSEDVRKIKALKYLLILVEWYLCLKPTQRSLRKLPNQEEIAQAIKYVDADILEGIRKRFADDRQINKWQTDNLLTHICALALTIDTHITDTYDLCADLRLEQKQLNALYKELGCRLSAPTEPQRRTLGLSKQEASAHWIASLVIPLEFPKLRVRGVGGKRRR